MERKIEEKILWINSQNRTSIGDYPNNFYYDIYGYINPNARNITVQLIQCLMIASDTAYYFDDGIIKILIDFGVSHNQFSYLNNFINVGLINARSSQNNYCDISIHPTPIYKLKDIPTRFINIQLLNYNNEVITDNRNAPNAGDPPGVIILCLKFTYEI